MESMEYQVLWANSSKDLAAQVNREILYGWRPQGGIAYNAVIVAQAMVRKIRTS